MKQILDLNYSNYLDRFDHPHPNCVPEIDIFDYFQQLILSIDRAHEFN